MRTVKICNLRMYNLSLFSFFSFVALNTNKNNNTSACKYMLRMDVCAEFCLYFRTKLLLDVFLVNLLGYCRE